MKSTQSPPAPVIDLAIAIARAVRDCGGRALVVGGFVRDRISQVRPEVLSDVANWLVARLGR